MDAVISASARVALFLDNGGWFSYHPLRESDGTRGVCAIRETATKEDVLQRTDVVFVREHFVGVRQQALSQISTKC